MSETNDDKSNEETQELGHKKCKKICLAALVCLLLAVAVVSGGMYYIQSLAYHVCRVEAGVSVLPSDFLKNPNEDVFFTDASQPFDITEPGEYNIQIQNGMFVYRCTLIIEDTIAPTGSPVQMVMEMGDTCEADSFVTDIADATQVTVTYAETPDFTKAGNQTVEVVLTDKGNNQTILDAELFISQIRTDLTIEAGSGAPDINSFIIEAKEASFVTDIDAFDYTKVGDYEVSLKADGYTYQVMMHIEDTQPPEVEVRDLERYALISVSANDFTVSAEDVTEITMAFKEEPDLSYIGTQNLEIVYTDGGGNETVKQVSLTLLEDTEKPVINGAVDLRAFIGESVSYRRGVTVTDNCPDGLIMNVDTAAVNLGEEGVYPVTYTARDAAGNTASVTVNLTVTEKVYDINEVNAMADSILATIITPEMDQLAQARAIFDYVRTHVSYIEHSEKGNWVRGAYEGLVYGKGDCFVYASTAKVLLTRAGISNMDIEKVPSSPMHYWNLVDVGDGWYHFDTTPRWDHPVMFMWSEEQLMNYSARNRNSHNYDHSLYPVVN